MNISVPGTVQRSYVPPDPAKRDSGTFGEFIASRKLGR